MNKLRLHFPNRAMADHPLDMGAHRIVREASGNVGVGEHLQGALLARICVDRRGRWLQVANGLRGVHVNGRPIKRMAMLRAGDAVYVDGVELLLQAPVADPQRLDQTLQRPIDGDPRIVLRGVGGPYHGRCFPLQQPCLIGSGRGASIHIDDVGDRHAQIELHGGQAVLRDFSGSGNVLVNGIATGDSVLNPGDQVVFGSQHRFVLEVPWGSGPIDLPADTGDDVAAAQAQPTLPPRRSALRWPWLLLAAAALAAALSALLLFGAG
ncbi:FHA domain-containing protein [Pseudoxanthomonas dokdonensis]|uniref:FHA domain-containing protein n=1 Tax=Pseudoxanthomonas dokdonensis TaxID=344882 RepID=A0A0R0CYZ0_9GAMM|nr:FHA domain-containing protein [Pseudoxanthomonas dokdonensis]KRG71089.1 hypothetical protein ABB29_04525 [Pseudoxanthomonas dokdonensis]